MDKIDSAIVALLIEDARMPNSDIAKKLKMATSAIWERIKKLEESGIIQKYTAVVNPAALGLNILAFVSISVVSANWSDKFAKNLKKIKNIEELHEVIGEDSYLAKIRVKDMQELYEILKNKISVIPEIKSTKTITVINTLK